MNALQTMVLGWRNLTAAMLRQHSSILLACHCACARLLRAALHAWSPHKAVSRGAVLAAPCRPPSLLSIWLHLTWQRSAQGEHTEPDTHLLLSTVDFMLHTAQLQCSADLDRAHVRTLRRLLRLLSLRLHTQSQVRMVPRHCAAMAVPGQLLV